MKSKKIFAGLLSLAMITAALASPLCSSYDGLLDEFSLSANAETFGDYTYSILSGGTVEITKYSGTDTTVNIPSEINELSVTSIGKNAFMGCKKIINLTIPNSIINIGESAFANCYNISALTIPDSVQTIGFSSFINCSGLNSLKLSNSLKKIGDRAFFGCINLSKVIIPYGVEEIGTWAFEECTGLSSVTISDTVKTIGYSAFNNCTELKEIIIPESVTYIGRDAFTNTLWLELKQKENKFVIVNNILIDASTCEGDVIVPDGITRINPYAFGAIWNEEFAKFESKITSITIPDTVTSIGDGAFSYCVNLTKMIIPDNVESIESFAFNECSGLTYVRLSNKMTEINGSLFAYCSNLKSVTVPNTIQKIGYGAFNKCSSLESIYYSGTETEWNSINISKYSNDYLKNSYKYYNMNGNVLHQKKLDNTAVRFVYLADIQTVIDSDKADVAFKGDRTAVGSENLTEAFLSIIANGKTVTAPEGKCYIVSSPLYYNEVSSEWAAEFSLYQNDVVTTQSQGICKIK